MAAASYDHDEKVNNYHTYKIEWSDKFLVTKTVKPKKAPKLKQHSTSKKVLVDEKDEHDEQSYFYAREVDHTLTAEDGVKMVGLSGAVNLATAYAIDLVIEQTFLSTVGAELAYAAGVSAMGGIAGLAIGGLGAVGVGIYKYFQTKWENEENAKKQALINAKVDLFNEKLKTFLKVGDELLKLKKECYEQEIRLKNKMKQYKQNAWERFDPENKSIILIGPTGYGKSLLGNRLLGNKLSVYKISKSDENNIDYKVAKKGQQVSETHKLKKRTKQVRMTCINNSSNNKCNSNNNHSDVVFRVSVIDTCGDFDSQSNSKYYSNELAEFARHFGGINMFCILQRFDCKLHEHYQDLLKIYETFWGTNFWKHCVIVLTHCDKDTEENEEELNDELPTAEKKVRSLLSTVSQGRCENVPIFTFGKKNFQESVEKMFLLLNSENECYYDKYICDNVKSPLDKIEKQLMKKYKNYKKIGRELRQIQQDIENIRSQ